jgi:hypothetical protein
MSKFVPPFRMGDVVCYTPDKSTQIIHEVVLTGPSNYKYSTNFQAWIYHKDLVLVEPANKKSMEKLFKSLSNE